MRSDKAPPNGRFRARFEAQRGSLLVGMVLSVVLVAAMAYYDARQEANAGLLDFAAEQSTLARALAGALDPRAESAGEGALSRIERAGRQVILIAGPHGDDFRRTNGAVAHVASLADAVHANASWARLSREEAASLGLPARMAIAGIASIATAAEGHATLVVVATAQAERDRQFRAELRLVLVVALAAGLVIVFGGAALRIQRTELELARELAVTEAARILDERLVRADKLATMGALATGVAHEVSTPLGVIVGRAEQLRPKLESDPRALVAVDAILAQGERIGRVIRGFLALARGESPPFENVEPGAIARASIDLVGHRFDKARVTLDAEIAEGLKTIDGEPRLLEQALVNLLLNACDACAPGGHVTLAVTAAGDDRIELVVTDDGEGIAESIASRVVEPFFTTKPEGRGTGLGLAIASEIVKHHRGSFAIEPRRGVRGTRAVLSLPASPRKQGEA